MPTQYVFFESVLIPMTEYSLIILALQLLRIETEGAYAALVAGSPAADAQGDAVRSALHTIFSVAALILAPAITSLAD